MTVHSALQIFGSGSDYTNLTNKSLAQFQTRLENLHVIILDEVSMCGARLLYNIHMRLQEIKKCSPNCMFGNVTIIAAGDLFQLPPIGDRKIYSRLNSKYSEDLLSLHDSIWQQCFLLHELTQIVRQKDATFAKLLLRVRHNVQTEEDHQLLMTRVVPTDSQLDSSILHIFATNAEALAHNVVLLKGLPSEIFVIEARDARRDVVTSQMHLRDKVSEKRSETGNLETVLRIAEGAIVKLTANLDVSDGLVNGARGEVKKIVLSKRQGCEKEVHVILVAFFDERVGRQARMISIYKMDHPDAVPIQKHQVQFKLGSRKVSCSRLQFPLTLCWGTTIHSVQGITLDALAIDMAKIRNPGQVYVALSRCKTLEGLFIKNYRKTAFMQDRQADAEMERMRLEKPLVLTHISPFPDNPQVCHLNINGLLCHMQDFYADVVILAHRVICLTETHLSDGQHIPALLGKQYFRKDRHRDRKGGIVVYVDDSCKAELLEINIPEVELLIVRVVIMHVWTTIVTIYRPPSFHKGTFVGKLAVLCEKLPSGPTIIHGDFNEDLHTSTSIKDMLQGKGYVQIVQGATHDSGSLLDHCYVKDIFTNTMCGQKDTYYSDHCLVSLEMK